LTRKQENSTTRMKIRRLFSYLFPFVDQRHDYVVSSSRARGALVALLAGAKAVPNF